LPGVTDNVIDFDAGLRRLRSPAKVHAVMNRRRLNARKGSSDKPPPHTPGAPIHGAPALLQQAA